MFFVVKSIINKLTRAPKDIKQVNKLSKSFSLIININWVNLIKA